MSTSRFLQAVRRRSGLTLIEFVVVFAIIAALIGLLLPAVQAARETTRSLACQSKLREFTLASKMCSDAINALPESRIMLDPETNRSQFERTWGRTVAPFLVGNVANQWSTAQRAFDLGYEDLYSVSPSILQCPSSIIKQTLDRFSPLVGHPIAVDLTTETLDYRGNLGLFDPSFANRGIGGQGPFAILKGTSEPIKEASITDGLSNTVYAWETLGAGKAHFTSRGGEEIVIERWNRSNCLEQIFFENSDKPEDVFEVPPGSSLHGHYAGWPGFASGLVFVGWAIENITGRYIPSYLQSNSYGDPFSLHPSGINVSMSDGSIRRIRRDIEWTPLVAIIQKNEGSDTVVNPD